MKVTSDNYKIVMKLLKERFDNNVLIFSSHITELFNIPAMARNNSGSLRNIIDTVTALHSSLLSLGSEVDVRSSIIIHFVLSKVDSDTKSANDEKQDFKKIPSWDECYKLLGRQFLAGRNINSKNKIQSKRSLQSFVDSTPSCGFCKATDHFLGNLSDVFGKSSFETLSKNLASA